MKQMTAFRKIGPLLIVALLVYNAPVAQPRTQSKSGGTNSVPTVNFCDLTVHPERYAGKLVRVKATIISWWESSYLYNVKCETTEKKIHDGVDCSNDADCERIGREAYDIINRAQQTDSDGYVYRANLTIVGRLVGPSTTGFGHLNGFKFEFRIRTVESAESPSK